MSRIEIAPFADEHVDAAADLLADAHEAHRAGEPLLAAAGDPKAHVERAWRRDGASGMIAFRGGDPAWNLARMSSAITVSTSSGPARRTVTPSGSGAGSAGTSRMPSPCCWPKPSRNHASSSSGSVAGTSA